MACAARFDESPLYLRAGDDAAALFRAPWPRLGSGRRCKRREAERLRNGGLYRTAARTRLTVVPLPVSRCEDCTEVMLVAKEAEEVEEPGEEPVQVVCQHEPKVSTLAKRLEDFRLTIYDLRLKDRARPRFFCLF